MEPLAKYAKKEGRQFSLRKTGAGREPALPALTKAGSEMIRVSRLTGLWWDREPFQSTEIARSQGQKWPWENGRRLGCNGKTSGPHPLDSGLQPFSQSTPVGQ